MEPLHCTANPVSPCSLRDPSSSNWFRNINLIAIGYASRPRLRCRLTLRRLTLRRKPWAFGEGVFHPLYRYLCQHSHFRYLQLTSQSTFAGLRNAPLPRLTASVASAPSLAPVNLPRRPTRPVSYYAFFKGWLLLSQPPGCLSLPTSFPTELGFGGLS